MIGLKQDLATRRAEASKRRAAIVNAVQGARRALSPGLIATAEIKSGNRRIIEFLLSPLTRRVYEAGRER